MVDGTPCSEDKEACEFRLEIKYKYTMTLDGDRLFADNYKLYNYADREARTPLDESQFKDEVVVGDGWTPARQVTVVNDTMPGPCLLLYKGQKATVHVFNDLPSEGLTIHWHGLHMTNNAYNDGVAFVTQCPILPGQTFTYTFTAETTGTYWYHSHIGSQRTMGILGPLIVREKQSQSPLQERVLVLQDWNHDVTSDQMEIGFFSGSGKDQYKAGLTKSLDGGDFSPFAFQSGLINGRGRYYTGSMNVQTKTPLEVIEVDQNQQYRFRVIAAGNLHPFRVAVEGHRLSVVASDGWDFRPVTAESFIINPGERYDFVLTTNQTVNNYLIYAETLEVDISNPDRHVAEAVLRYAGIFLNFAFPGKGEARRQLSSVNGIKFVHPPLAAILQAKENKDLPTACESTCGQAQQQCECSHVETLTRDRVHQFVLLDMGDGSGFSHPIHMHGYSFYVVKVGYPTYSQSNGSFSADNPDIDCRGPADRTKTFCNTATWKNETWRAENGGVVPGLNLDNPIRKDTIIVPTGGYVVVRIKADNPGMWYMHCHIEMHHLSGMALMLDGTAPSFGPVPQGFPTCNEDPADLGGKTNAATGTRGVDFTLLLLLAACVTRLNSATQ
nr:hypothetical protein BaRGS_006282 [Batillaria attramentaria]